MAKIVVPGGNGFIGTEICRLAVENGHEVAAFGRSGRPALTPAVHPWTQEVQWRAADVFEPATWRDLLDGADAVVHCIATIREAPEHNVTFNRLNAEAAFLAAEELAEAGGDAFVFMSVGDKPPLVNPAFLAAKRRVDRKLPQSQPDLRFVSLRPNLVFGSGLPGTGTLAGVLESVKEWRLHSYASPEGRPLPVELVAATAVQAAITSSIEGPLSVSQIEDIGRTSGLVDLDDLSESSLAPFLIGMGATAAAAWLLQRLLRR